MKSKPRILLLTYYWPPSGSVAVHRWYYMSKHLADLGYDIRIIVPENANYPTENTNLTETLTINGTGSIKIIKRKILEVRNLFQLITRGEKKKTDDIFFKQPSSLSYKERISLWVRANIFIPDARVPWFYQQRTFVTRYIEREKIDVLITTGPPHSLHLHGLRLRKEKNTKWLADFRDPWTTIEYHDKMPMNKRAKKRHFRLESEVLRKADKVIAVSPSWAQEFRSMGASDVSVVYNGYEEETFKAEPKNENSQIIISHMGTLRSDRNPHKLWKVLSTLKETFVLRLYGEVSDDVKKSIEQFDLTKKTRYMGHVHHDIAIQAMHESRILLLPINKNSANAAGRIPAKLYEYMRSGRAILILQETMGDASDITSNTSYIKSVLYEDEQGISNAVTQLLSNPVAQQLSKNVIKYSRKNQAHALSQILNEICTYHK